MIRDILNILLMLADLQRIGALFVNKNKKGQKLYLRFLNWKVVMRGYTYLWKLLGSSGSGWPSMTVDPWPLLVENSIPLLPGHRTRSHFKVSLAVSVNMWLQNVNGAYIQSTGLTHKSLLHNIPCFSPFAGLKWQRPRKPCTSQCSSMTMWSRPPSSWYGTFPKTVT